MTDGTTETQSRWSDLMQPDHLAATATVALGVVLFAFNAFVVATALPAAVADFGGREWLAWATALYILASMVSGPSTAAAMHRLGARRLFLGAGAIFLTGTLMAAFAPGIFWLLAGRALQGLGGGFIESGCYVLIPRLFPPRLISRVFGVEAVAWAVAAFAAPSLAGWLAEIASWRLALLSAVPMALVFLYLVPRVVREEAGGEAPGLPFLPLLGVASGMALVLVSDGAGWLSGPALAAGVAVFVLTLRLDGRARVRLFPRGAFGAGALGAGLWLALLMPLSQSAESVFLPYGLQMLWGWTPLAAGLGVTVLALAWSAVQAATAGVAGAGRQMVLWGAVALVAGQGAMVWAFVATLPWLMLMAQAVIGAAFGLSWGRLSQMVMEEAGAERDMASGLLPVVMSAGYGIGAALYGTLANAVGFASAEGEGLRGVLVLLFALAGGVALVALVPALRASRPGSSR